MRRTDTCADRHLTHAGVSALTVVSVMAVLLALASLASTVMTLSSALAAGFDVALAVTLAALTVAVRRRLRRLAIALWGLNMLIVVIGSVWTVAASCVTVPRGCVAVVGVVLFAVVPTAVVFPCRRGDLAR